MTPGTRIVVVDDHDLLRVGLRARLEKTKGFEIVGEAATAADALRVISQVKCDLVILDLQLPDESGIEVTKKVKAQWPEVRVLVLTGNTPITIARDVMQAGANGLLRKEDAIDDLERAIAVVTAGKTYLSPDAATALATELRAPPPPAAEKKSPLTERELAVLKRVAEGLSYKEIAAELDVSVKSVETYRARLAKKLGMNTRAEMVRYAVRAGIVSA